MKCAKTALVSWLLVFLTACGSSSVVEDRYYSLVLATGNDSTTNDQSKGGQIVVGPIELPAYLSRQGLPIQSGNRIESAHHHLWAEPLEDAIGKALVRDLAKELAGVDVARDAGRWTSSAKCRVRVEFDAFHPTNDSKAVTSGRYWLVSGDSSQQRQFNLSRTLTRDGYAHAVDTLRGSLQALARQISDDIRQTPACADSP